MPLDRERAMDMGGNTIPMTGGSSGIGRERARPTGDLHGAALRWSARLLVAASWVSAAIFAAYILDFFGGVAVGGDSQRWNEALPWPVRCPLAPDDDRHRRAFHHRRRAAPSRAYPVDRRPAARCPHAPSLAGPDLHHLGRGGGFGGTCLHLREGARSAACGWMSALASTAR